MRLLLIEDDTPIARELLLRWRDGERLAQHAATLAEADAALAQAGFDIVLLDLGMPDGDGMDWLAAYRQRDPQGAVLVMTPATASRTESGGCGWAPTTTSSNPSRPRNSTPASTCWCAAPSSRARTRSVSAGWI